MNIVQQKFNSLEKREQYILLLGAAFVIFYLVYGVFYSSLITEKDKYKKRVESTEETLVWMSEAVQTIKTLKKSSGTSSNSFTGKSLSQLSEFAAKKSGVRISRFQPKGDSEAQVWFDRVEFDKLVDFLARLEVDYGVVIDTLSVTSANSPGLVNARLKFIK